VSTITIQEEAQMEVVPFRFQLDGRLRNIGRPKEWYMAVAEAVKNAFDAIEASGRTGQIEVELQRGEDLLSSVGTAGPVQNVIIRDTGIGFDQTNFESFCTPDSLLKSTAGGKGLGRFICLQAFKRMEGTSVYRNGIGSMRREFVFQSEKPELRQLLVPIKAEENLTEVMLLGLREEYLPTATVEFEKLVDWLGEHFLPALVEKPDWLQALIVRDGNKREDLTAKISAGAIWRESFKVKNYDFNTACYAFAHDDDCDQVRLVAGARVVDASTRGLGYYVPHLENVADEKGHVVLVTSPFFDEHVNDARNGISFYEEGEEQALFGITAAQFRQGLAEALTHKLIGRLTRSNLDLRNRIEAVVRKEAPPYRPLLEGYFASKEFMQVRPDDMMP
jgi:anti-sigma regulatory factor (Ser/Thr protein kinase)